jgi:hypothetical protein
MTHFPDHPHDGQTVVEEIGNEQVRIWTYSQANNEWTYKEYGGGGPVVYTDQVMVRENATGEGTHSALAEPSELKTQKEVNWYLDEKFGQGPDINLDDYATQQQLAALQQEVDNLTGLVVQARYSNGYGISTRPGEFLVIKNDTQQTRFSEGETIRFDEKDATNRNPALVRIIAGDLIHIVDPRNSQFTVLQVTQAAGIVHSYNCLGGTLDSIPGNTALEFRISGAS